MERKQLTDDVIAALAPKRKRRLVYDTEVRSLAVSVVVMPAVCPAGGPLPIGNRS